MFSFEHADDYVYDVKWSPRHRALFATVDGTGNLSLWNICNETEVPVAGVTVSDKALNKAKWSADGKKVLVGDSAGKVYVYDVASQIASPRQDEKLRMEKLVASVRHSMLPLNAP